MKRGAVPFGIFFLLDAVYMLIVTVIFSFFIYAVNNGGFRSYLLIGTIVGMAVYFLTVGRIVMMLSEAIVRFLGRVFDLLVVKPVRFIVKLIVKITRWTGTHTVGKLLYWLRRMNGYRYTEKRKRRLARDIVFADDLGKGRKS